MTASSPWSHVLLVDRYIIKNSQIVLLSAAKDDLRGVIGHQGGLTTIAVLGFRKGGKSHTEVCPRPGDEPRTSLGFSVNSYLPD